MGFLSRLCWAKIQHTDSLALYFFPIFFGIVSTWAFYLFLKIKVVRLSATTIQFSHLVLPVRKKYLIKQVSSISQHTKQISIQDRSWSPIRINYRITSFTFADNRVIKMDSIGPLDFEELTQCYNKITRGQGEAKMAKKKFARYLIESMEDIWVVILFLIITIGFGIALLIG